jgi:hypothetical protein
MPSSESEDEPKAKKSKKPTKPGKPPNLEDANNHPVNYMKRLNILFYAFRTCKIVGAIVQSSSSFSATIMILLLEPVFASTATPSTRSTNCHRDVANQTVLTTSWS